MSVVSNVVKITNSLSYANDPSGLSQGEYQTSEVFVYNGNVYPIYQQMIWIPALPDTTTALFDHYITDYPSNPQLPIWLHGVAQEPGEIYRNFDAYGSTLEYAISPTFIEIRTLDDKSNFSGFVTIKYCKQNSFTPIENF